MPLVIYAAPWFSETTVRYLEALLQLPGVHLAVISPDPQEQLVSHVRHRLVGHWRVSNMLDSGELAYAVSELAHHLGPVHRIFTHQEQFQVPLAEVRERLGIPGMHVEAAQNFRDKARMKQVLRAAGLPCARHARVTDAAGAWRFVDEVGYPIVAKPVAGAASQATVRIDGADGLHATLDSYGPRPDNELLLEEFVQGEEHSFDTFSVKGRAVWHSITHYFPSPLQVLQTPWIQWAVLLPREVDHPRYDDIRAVGCRALEVLGMDSGLSHLEWFRRADGSIAISEVAARPPGGHFTKLMSWANDFSCVDAWVRVMVYDQFDPPERRYAAGAAYLRGLGHGRVVNVHGLEQAQHELGPLVVEARLPQIGQQSSSSYEGEGYIIVRHPETGVVQQAIQRLVSIIRVELG